MGWLRLVRSLKLQVSFVKKPYKRDYILQKRPIILRSLLIEATPYLVIYAVTWNLDRNLDSFIYGTRLIHMYRKTHLCVWPVVMLLCGVRHLFMYVTFLCNTCDRTHLHGWRDSFIWTRLIHAYDMAASYTWQRPHQFSADYWDVSVASSRQNTDMSQEYMRYDSFICTTRLICICDSCRISSRQITDMSQYYMRHDAFTLNDMTHSHMWQLPHQFAADY